MFNLIVAGDMYDFIKQESGNESFPVSRLLESTPEDIRNKLLPLTDNSLRYLSSLPVLFMTEPEKESCDDFTKAEFSEIRIGGISNLKVGKSRRDIVIEFEFIIHENLGKCKLNNDNDYSNDLSLGGFGLHRTHWSIKKLDIDEALELLGVKKRPPLFKSKKTNPPKKKQK
ncbi:TPA: hypothetical protein ACPYUS_000512 [Klebsiella pneumoniae]